MRILWLTVDRSHRVAQQFDVFRDAVKKDAEVVELKKYPAGDRGQNMWQISQRIIAGKVEIDNIVIEYLERDSNFDFIFCDAFFAFLGEEWKSINIPTGIFIEDIHYKVPRRQIEVANQNGISTIFHRFNFGFHKFHPNARRDFKCFWLPHSVNTRRFKDLKEKRSGVLHVGVHPKAYYPWRANAVEQLKTKSYFTYIPRPKELGNRDNKWPIDNEYARLVNIAKICVTGGSIYNAPVQKYVEIPACNTLLMSNWFPDLGLMGYRDNYNMVAYTPENLIKKVEGLLKDGKRLSYIAKNGMSLMLSNHTSEIRSKQFINNICQILDKPLEYPKTSPCSYQVNFKRIPGAIRISEPELIEEEKKVEEIVKEREFVTLDGIVSGTDWRSRINES